MLGLILFVACTQLFPNVTEEKSKERNYWNFSQTSIW